MLDFLKSKDKFLCSPMKGEVVSIKDVPDEAFSTLVLGDGFAVKPTDGNVYSPCDGEVAVVFETLHAISITSNFGADVLIHVGLETVSLKGEPFEACVKVGDKVSKGDLLLKADLKKIEDNNLNTITPVLVCNVDDFKKIELLKSGLVENGEEVLKAVSK